MKRLKQLAKQLGISLNPFEFRAGLKPDNAMSEQLLAGLNPFEFRAGLKPTGTEVHAARAS